MRIVAQRFDIETEGEAFLGTSEVNKGGAKDAIEHGVGVVERGSVAGKAMEELLVLVERGEDRTLAPQDIDVADEAMGGVAQFVEGHVQVEPEIF